MSKTNPLDPAAVLETLLTLLPSENSSAGRLQSPHDGLAALFHAILSRLDFRLVGLGEEDRLSDYPSAASAAARTEASSPSSSTSASTAAANVLPSPWNRLGPESYTLRYRHDQSSLTFLLKLLRMSNRMLVNASAVESGKTATWEIQVDEYTSKSFYPYPRAATANEPKEPLVHGYISSSRVNDLISTFKSKIIQKLVPGLRKEGYEEDADDNATQASASSSRQNRPTPARPPYYHDPDDPRPTPSGPDTRGPYYPGRNPLAIGDRDLDPLGGARPPGAGAGYGPPPLFGGGGGLGGGGLGGIGGGGGGGGMYVGPDDPIFRDRFRNPQAGGGGGGLGGMGQGPWGGDGFLPPGAVPPGARFDPVGPFGAGPGRGPFGPGGAAGGLGGAAGQPRGQRTGDPDWDDVRPPRGDSDYDNMYM